MITHRITLWKTTLVFEGVSYEAQWNRSYDEEKDRVAHDVYLNVVLSGTSANVPLGTSVVREFWGTSIENDALENKVYTAVSQARVHELQQRYGHASNLEERIQNATQLLERLWKQEYLGHYSNSYCFYFDMFQDILLLSTPEMYEMFGKLQDEEKVGLNGMIIVPFEEESRNYKMLEEKTGHHRLDVTDSGNWYCSDCNNFRYADDENYVSPKDVACVAKH